VKIAFFCISVIFEMASVVWSWGLAGFRGGRQRLKWQESLGIVSMLVKGGLWSNKFMNMTE
jgi:hypothetical protein